MDVFIIFKNTKNGSLVKIDHIPEKIGNMNWLTFFEDEEAASIVLTDKTLGSFTIVRIRPTPKLDVCGSY